MEFAETLPKQIGNVKLNYEFYPGEDIDVYKRQA